MNTPARLIEDLRSRGQRATPQRHAVFEALWENRSHPTAEAVWATVVEHMPTVSLRTVYSVLGELVAAGEITQVDLGTGASRFDPNTSGHHHLVCDRCGMVVDVQVDHDDVRPTNSAINHLSADAHRARDGDGFRVTGTQIVFRGMCSRCDASDPPPPPPHT